MGPLRDLKVLEFAGIGPGPMCAMLLADLGATVLRIERPQATDLGVPRPPRFDLLRRGRKSIAIDLKAASGRELVLDLVGKAEALIEGFRPGVMERLGLGPDVCFQRNPRMVYGRMTGWGQAGPLATSAGHDLNYIALSGALFSIGRNGGLPAPPLNLVGDYAGALYLAFGLLAAVLSARQGGKGQVVEAAMVDSAAHLLTSLYGLHAAGAWSAERGTNIIDSGAPYYDVYPCADGQLISVAAIEAKFFREFVRILGLNIGELPAQNDRARWDESRAVFARQFKTRSRDEWCRLFADTDACVAPVLNLDEAPRHPHLVERGTFIEIDGILQPAPAPRFSETQPAMPSRPVEAAECSAVEALQGWVGDVEAAMRRARGAIGAPR